LIWLKQKKDEMSYQFSLLCSIFYTKEINACVNEYADFIAHSGVIKWQKSLSLSMRYRGVNSLKCVIDDTQTKQAAN